MVAYNFQDDFEAPILSGIKQSTIRPEGKRRHAVAGDELQLYVGMRTSSCRLLMRVPCLWSRPIVIHRFGFDVEDGGQSQLEDTAMLARIEGFDSFGNMQAWFDHRYGLPAIGFRQIRWDFGAATFVRQDAENGEVAP